MDVGPEDEEREDEVDAPVGFPSLRCEEPDEPGEEREREDLCSDRERPGCRQEDGKEGEEDRPWSGAERASCDRRDRECGEGKQRDDNREQTVAAKRVRSIGEELRAPLLIGPVASEPEHGELVCARKAVLDDLASRDERQPGVCDKSVGGKTVRKTIPNAA